MRSGAALLLGSLILRTQAQATDDVPVCARACVSETIRSSGCAHFDIACQCQRGAYGDAYKSCLRGSCSPTDARAIGEFSSNSCLIHLRSLLDKSSTTPFTSSSSAGASTTPPTTTTDAFATTPTAPANQRESNSALTTTQPEPSDSSGSPGLSAGAKAGIGVGVIAAFLLGLILAGAYVWRSRKRKANEKDGLPPHDHSATDYHHGAPGYPQSHVSMAKFEPATPVSPATPVAERAEDQHPSTIHSPAPAYEMGPSEMPDVTEGKPIQRVKSDETQEPRRLYELP